jgi:hypothetical protein
MISERLDLNKLLRESDAADNTETIRRMKHSGPLIESICVMETLKRTHRELRTSDPQQFFILCTEQCKFYFSNYMDLFQRQMKDELNLAIMIRMIRFMELIEQGQMTQHEASVIVGKYLKELYIDSAIRKSDHLDEQHETNTQNEPVERNVGWKEYKKSIHG